MILGIMQPYFFPYLGYYQLARSVDHFVFLDDVAFSRRSFINRNRILLEGRPFQFSIPVSEASSTRNINEHRFTGDFGKFLAQLRQTYAKAPFFQEIYALVESVALDPEQNVALKNARSITAVFDYLDVPLSSASASQSGVARARGQERILALCRHHATTTYHNASGGRTLYDAACFNDNGIGLRFLANSFPPYDQGTGEAFVPGLSIIDVLMHAPPEQARSMLQAYALETATSATTMIEPGQTKP